MAHIYDEHLARETCLRVQAAKRLSILPKFRHKTRRTAEDLGAAFAYTNMLKRILTSWTVDSPVSDDVSRN